GESGCSAATVVRRLSIPYRRRVVTTVFERRQPAASVVRRSLENTHQSVFWMDEIPRPSYPSLPGGMGADLVIVGGGYTGLWTAILAKQRDPGRTVVVLEGRRVGWAASGRNGGFVEASLTHGDQNGMSRWPED